MIFPTWDDVGIPDLVVASIRQMKPSPLLDSLIHQIVWHYPKRLNANYYCDNCGYRYVPERANEQISVCQGCSSPMLRLNQFWRYNKEKAPIYTRLNSHHSGDLSPFFEEMNKSYQLFLGDEYNNLEEIWDWGYQRNRFWVKFLGGTKIFSDRPVVAAYKAGLLVPFLWNSSLDWKNSAGSIGDGFICHLLSQWGRERE